MAGEEVLQKAGQAAASQTGKEAAQEAGSKGVDYAKQTRDLAEKMEQEAPEAKKEDKQGDCCCLTCCALIFLFIIFVIGSFIFGSSYKGNKNKFPHKYTNVEDCLTQEYGGGGVLGDACVPAEGKKYLPIMNEAAKKYGVDPALIAAHIEVESGWNASSTSGSGAQGLMQVMPGTFGDFAVDGNNDGQLSAYDPADNIFTGAKYIRYIHTEALKYCPSNSQIECSWEVRTAGYNSGPGYSCYKSTNDYTCTGFSETIAYVPKVREAYEKYKKCLSTMDQPVPVPAPTPSTASPRPGTSTRYPGYTDEQIKNCETIVSQQNSTGPLSSDCNLDGQDIKLTPGTIDHIYLHWSASGNDAVFSEYHFNILGDGKIVQTADPNTTLPHTSQRNTNSVGISVSSMCDYKNTTDWQNWYGSSCPPTDIQIKNMAKLVAKIAAYYKIPIDKKHVMTHAEAAAEDCYLCGKECPGETTCRWDLLHHGDKIRAMAQQCFGGGEPIVDPCTTQSQQIITLPISTDASYGSYSSPEYQSGRADVICRIQTVAKIWKQRHPEPYLLLMVGDINAPGHMSHTSGVDADIFVDTVTDTPDPNYNQQYAKELFHLFENYKFAIIFDDMEVINSSINISNPSTHDAYYPYTYSSCDPELPIGLKNCNHDNHFHVRYIGL